MQFTSSLKALFLAILSWAFFRAERQEGQGVARVAAPIRSTMARLRPARAAARRWSTAWAGVEPQQLQSGGLDER